MIIQTGEYPIQIFDNEGVANMDTGTLIFLVVGVVLVLISLGSGTDIS